jgi:transposase
VRKKDARKNSPEVQQEKRKQAVKLKKTHLTNLDISKTLGVHYGTVCKWFREYKSHGMRGIELQKRGRSFGEQRTLSTDQENEIRRILTKRTPDYFSFNMRLWTRKGVVMLIEKLYGIQMPIRTIGEYLKRWKFTPQKPKKRANEQDSKKVKKWLKEEYPEILKRAKKEKAEIHWGDETGICNTDQRGRTYAPKGKTPVVNLPGRTKFRVNLISSITNQGKLRFMIFESGMSEKVLIRFLSRLIADVRKKVFVILDNLNVHKTPAVREWLKKNKKKIEVFYLPTYSPDLNPDEFLNCDLKTALASKKVALTKSELKKSVISQMRFLQKNPDRIIKYFQAETIKYAA